MKIEIQKLFHLREEFFTEIISRTSMSKGSDNVIAENEESGGVCLSCENIVGLTKSKFDIQITRKLVINNVEGYLCNECGEVVSFDLDVVMDIMKEIETFKAERPSIKQLLSTSDDSSYRWCENIMCACSGAANCSGSLSDYLYTKRDWVIWKSDEPYKETEFNMAVNSIENRMTAIKAFVEYFNYPDKKTIYNALKFNHANFGLSYVSGSQEAINKDKEKCIEFFKSKGVDMEIYNGAYKAILFYKNITFVKELKN